MDQNIQNKKKTKSLSQSYHNEGMKEKAENTTHKQTCMIQPKEKLKQSNNHTYMIRLKFELGKEIVT